jgi:hypothetical protein
LHRARLGKERISREERQIRKAEIHARAAGLKGI